MVKADRGDNREDGHDDIGRIPGAAQPSLNDGDIDLLVAEVEEGDQSGDLKERCLPFDLGEEVADIVFGDRFAIDADPFAEGGDVGGGVEADLPTCLLQGGGDLGADRSLAIGSRDMDRREGELRMVVYFAEAFYIREAAIHPLLSREREGSF